MGITKYNKLIRDRIPEIIEKSGKSCIVETLNDEAFFDKLIEKLKEEMSEFIAEAENQDDENAIKELADLEEVILALVKAIGVSRESFERIREAKKLKTEGLKENCY
jgi:Uncharacterized conserved protein